MIVVRIQYKFTCVEINYDESKLIC
jgi:hypothetical protein